MSEQKSKKWGLFPGGDPRDFTPDSTASEDQQNSWRFDCSFWDAADADGKMPSGYPSQEVYGDISMSDCAESIYGGGVFEIETPSPEPTELGEAEFDEIMGAPSLKKLPFVAVLG
jgi:hypothetical protein